MRLSSFVSASQWYIKDDKVYCSDCGPKINAAKTYDDWWLEKFPKFGSAQDWKCLYNDKGLEGFEGNDGGCVYYNINGDSKMHGKLAISCFDGHGRTGIYTFLEDPKNVLSELIQVGSIHKFLENKSLDTDFG